MAFTTAPWRSMIASSSSVAPRIAASTITCCSMLPRRPRYTITRCLSFPITHPSLPHNPRIHQRRCCATTSIASARIVRSFAYSFNFPHLPLRFPQHLSAHNHPINPHMLSLPPYKSQSPENVQPDRSHPTNLALTSLSPRSDRRTVRRRCSQGAAATVVARLASRTRRDAPAAPPLATRSLAHNPSLHRSLLAPSSPAAPPSNRPSTLPDVRPLRTRCGPPPCSVPPTILPTAPAASPCRPDVTRYPPHHRVPPTQPLILHRTSTSSSAHRPTAVSPRTCAQWNVDRSRHLAHRRRRNPRSPVPTGIHSLRPGPTGPCPPVRVRTTPRGPPRPSSAPSHCAAPKPGQLTPPHRAWNNPLPRGEQSGQWTPLP